VYLSLSAASARDIGMEDLAEITTLVVRKQITSGGLFSLKHGFLCDLALFALVKKLLVCLEALLLSTETLVRTEQVRCNSAFWRFMIIFVSI
jgi:hypothetical protein